MLSSSQCWGQPRANVCHLRSSTLSLTHTHTCTRWIAFSPKLTVDIASCLSAPLVWQQSTTADWRGPFSQLQIQDVGYIQTALPGLWTAKTAFGMVAQIQAATSPHNKPREGRKAEETGGEIHSFCICISKPLKAEGCPCVMRRSF